MKSFTFISALIYTTLSLAASLAFLFVTWAGDYPWVARGGGSGWVFALSMIVLMPVITSYIKKVMSEQKPKGKEDQSNTKGGVMFKFGKKKVKDPVCGMEIAPDKAAAQMEYQGKTYYFCSHDCHSKFMAEPPKYATKSSAR